MIVRLFKIIYYENLEFFTKYTAVKILCKKVSENISHWKEKFIRIVGREVDKNIEEWTSSKIAKDRLYKRENMIEKNKIWGLEVGNVWEEMFPYVFVYIYIYIYIYI